jgi:hypothetical protein
MPKKLLPLISIFLIIAACAPKTPAPSSMNIDEAVAIFLTSQPPATIQPTYTPYPTYTPAAPALSGIFCEYQFCIGHPVDVAFFDVRESTEPSVYSDGILAAYRIPDYYNLFIWQPGNGTDDPQFMLDIVLDANVDSRVGVLDVNLVGELTTFYSAISNGSSIPSGGVAAWICGDRAFGWKVYSDSEERAHQLFEEAIAKFRCNK